MTPLTRPSFHRCLLPVVTLCVLGLVATAVAQSTPQDALDFDGVDDALEIADPLIGAEISALTIEAWIHRNVQATEDAAQWHTILSQGGTAFVIDPQGYLRLVHIISNGQTPRVSKSRARITEWQERGDLLEPNGADIWHHVAVVINGPTVTFYIDGNHAGESRRPDLAPEPAPVPFPLSPFAIDQVPVLIGATRFASDTANFFRGAMDEIRVWSNARSSSAIAFFAQREVPTANNPDLDYREPFAAGSPASGASAIGAPTATTWPGWPKEAVLFPDLDTEDLTPDGGGAASAFAGLWIGDAVITEVNEVQTAIGGASAPTPTADHAAVRVLLLVDEAGSVRLLKDVIVMREKNAGPFVLVTDPNQIPNYDGIVPQDGELVGLRFGTVAYDFESETLGMFGTVGPGKLCLATLDVLADSATNPFRHKFHPQHREGFALSRTMLFEFDSESDADSLSGTYTEIVNGLHKIPVIATGPFRLSRISTAQLPTLPFVTVP